MAATTSASSAPVLSASAQPTVFPKTEAERLRKRGIRRAEQQRQKRRLRRQRQRQIVVKTEPADDATMAASPKSQSSILGSRDSLTSLTLAASSHQLKEEQSEQKRDLDYSAAKEIKLALESEGAYIAPNAHAVPDAHTVPDANGSANSSASAAGAHRSPPCNHGTGAHYGTGNEFQQKECFIQIAKDMHYRTVLQPCDFADRAMFKTAVDESKSAIDSHIVLTAADIQTLGRRGNQLYILRAPGFNVSNAGDLSSHDGRSDSSTDQSNAVIVFRNDKKTSREPSGEAKTEWIPSAVRESDSSSWSFASESEPAGVGLGLTVLCACPDDYVGRCSCNGRIRTVPSYLMLHDRHPQKEMLFQMYVMLRPYYEKLSRLQLEKTYGILIRDWYLCRDNDCAFETDEFHLHRHS
jgi:hypothetical protein